MQTKTLAHSLCAMLAAASCADVARQVVASNGTGYTGTVTYTGPGPDLVTLDAVKASAVHDLGCPGERVTVGYMRSYRGGEYTADGCGYRAVYGIAYVGYTWGNAPERRHEAFYTYNVVLMGRFSLNPPAPTASPPPASHP
jgi:hypothetical protein